MINFETLTASVNPFEHWVADGFIAADLVAEINAAWPGADADWIHERGGYALKSALLFPRRLPPPAQRLADVLYAPPALATLSELVGINLAPDPWFLEGPLHPVLGGGLHEIWPGGRLGVHVDFEAHPSGLRRVANLLIYLNEGWQPHWGGALELHDRHGGARQILPTAGRAVLFRTTPASWHGHPHALACPPGRTRRSLALYYYAADDGAAAARPTTVYRKPKG